MEDTSNFPNFFDFLSSDLIELILSHLPIRAIIRSSAVCKLWHSITTSPSFTKTAILATTTPWFFLYGRNNIFSKNNQAFAFDPNSNEWVKLPTYLFPISNSQESSFIGAGGYFFTHAANNFSFSPILKQSWRETTPLKFSRLNPLVTVINHGFSPNLNSENGSNLNSENGFSSISNSENGFSSNSNSENGFSSNLNSENGFSSNSYSENRFDRNLNLPEIIVVGGVRFIGGLVDIEDNLAVEIYNHNLNSWHLCPPLPPDFQSANSSLSLSSSLLKSKLYVFGIYSSFISSFDLTTQIWSEVKTLRPPGVIISFIMSCRNHLLLAGICNNPCGPSFNLWRIEESTMEFSEVGIMPQDLLDCFFDSDEDDRFASLKCVGFGGFVFVFSEEYRRNYPACVCEIRPEYGEVTWKMVPGLPEPVNRFHKVVGFCSTISLHRILHG